VAQLNLYVPDDLAARLKSEARQAGQPLSRYVISLLSGRKKSGWPPGYFEKIRGCLSEDFAIPDDPPPEPFELSGTFR
jgi:hypothetical protein